jgi:hypothetical protein
MSTNESQLRERFMLAVDEVVHPAPWLEGRVVDAVRRAPRPPRGIAALIDRLELRSNVRFAAALAAVLIAAAAITALLMSDRIHTSPSPAAPRTPTSIASPVSSQTPWNPSDSTFTPTTVRSASWPAGGPVPANLAGAWNPQLHNGKTGVLYLGGYSSLVMIQPGDVVVNGSEIDFIYDPCGINRYRYTLTGDTLVLTRISDVCGTGLAGTYKRLPSQ